MLGAGDWYFPKPILFAATSSKGRQAVWAASMSFPIALEPLHGPQHPIPRNAR
jgi:hypothetical protein